MPEPAIKKAPRNQTKPIRTAKHSEKPVYDERKAFFDRYEWWFVALGLVGNAMFFVGSICFLSKRLETLAIGLFIGGSCFMLVSSSAESMAEYTRNKLKQPCD